jgi:hypothetical protein
VGSNSPQDKGHGGGRGGQPLSPFCHEGLEDKEATCLSLTECNKTNNSETEQARAMAQSSKEKGAQWPP